VSFNGGIPVVMSGEATPKKHLCPPWKPGQSGNPNGRPKGPRNKLGEAFLEALHEDFTEHGAAAIEQTRIEKPDAYLKVIASILPRELEVKETPFSDSPTMNLPLSSLPPDRLLLLSQTALEELSLRKARESLLMGGLWISLAGALRIYRGVE